MGFGGGCVRCHNNSAVTSHDVSLQETIRVRPDFLNALLTAMIYDSFQTCN